MVVFVDWVKNLLNFTWLPDEQVEPRPNFQQSDKTRQESDVDWVVHLL